MFDDASHDQRRDSQQVVNAKRRAQFLAAVVPLFEAGGFQETGGNGRITVYTRFVADPWVVQILMDESAVDGGYGTLDPTEPIWWVTASPDDAYEHALSVPLAFSVGRLHAMDALRVAEEVAELITFMLKKPTLTVLVPSGDRIH